MTGGDGLIESLKVEGVRAIFGMPGTQNIQIYDSLSRKGEGIKHFLVRNEQAATAMADGYARATGEEGVALVVPGPGAANGAAGMEEAMCDTSPVLLITGQLNLDQLIKRHPSKLIHGLDLQRVFAPICKYCGMAKTLAEVPQVVQAAFSAMRNGRPGPTLLSFPRDVMTAEGEVVLPMAVVRERQRPDPQDIQRAAEVLRKARRPLILAGAAVSAGNACGELRNLAEQLGVPVIVTRLGKGVIPEDHPLALSDLTGSLGGMAMARSDALLSVGVRFTSVDSLSWSLRIPHPHVQLDMDPEEIGREYPADAAVVGDLKLTLQALSNEMEHHKSEEWQKALREIKKESAAEPKSPVLTAIREVLDRKGILAVDVHCIGYRAFAEFPCYDPHTFLCPSIGGALGWAFPAALGAKAAFPERQVVCFTGDGGFLYNATELATAMKYGLNVVTVVVNDQALTTIQAAQLAMCEGRLIDTDLYNPDFVRFAESFGALGMRVEKLTEFKAALETALRQERPVVIELPMSDKRDELIRGIPSWFPPAQRLREEGHKRH